MSCLVMIWTLCVLAVGCARQTEPAAELALLLHCAAGLKRPVEQALARYQEAFGVEVQVQYGGSGTLLSGLELNPVGDLYIAADALYIDRAQAVGLVQERLPLARQALVIATPKNSPYTIHGIQDLLRPGLRLGLANPEQSAVGQVTRQRLRAIDQWEAVRDHALVFKPTVTDLLNDLALGSLDAAILWDATAKMRDDLLAVRTPSLANATYDVEVGVLVNSPDPARALHLARYLNAQDRGALAFRAHGFQPSSVSDAWRDHPQVAVYVGSMLRAGVADTLKDFAAREGCTIVTNDNDGGGLLAQMKAGAEPQAFFACDVSCIDPVRDRFQPARVLTETPIVVAVPKQNPAGVKSLQDLMQTQDARLGVCGPEQSALGRLTDAMLKTNFSAANAERFYARAAVQAATGDQLVLQLLSGGLDAAVVFQPHVMADPGYAERLTWFKIELPGARAQQPWAVANDAGHTLLLARLRDRLASAASIQRFRDAGFVWRMADPPPARSAAVVDPLSLDQAR